MGKARVTTTAKPGAKTSLAAAAEDLLDELEGSGNKTPEKSSAVGPSKTHTPIPRSNSGIVKRRGPGNGKASRKAPTESVKFANGNKEDKAKEDDSGEDDDASEDNDPGEDDDASEDNDSGEDEDDEAGENNDSGEDENSKGDQKSGDTTDDELDA